MKTDKKLSITAFFPAYNDAVTIPSLVLEADYILGGITDDFNCCIAASNASPRSGVAAALQIPAAEVVVLASPLHSITQTFYCIWYSSVRSWDGRC